MRKRFYLILVLLIALVCCMVSCSTTQQTGGTVPTLKITGDYSGCGIGVFLHDGEPSAESITYYEGLISREVAVVMWYLDFVSLFPTSACDIVHDHNSIPMLTWEPWNWGSSSDTSFSLDHIISGDCDSYITAFAISAESWGKPLFLRFAHEMNGNWYPWSGAFNGSDEAATSKYKAAWERIHATFEAVGAKNVTWVWCPMDHSNPTDDWNMVQNYYPGDTFVDWVAFDGYSNSGSTSSDDVLLLGYSSFPSAILSNKPVMVGEMACGTAEPATNKPLWIADAFNSLKNNYKKIKLYVWFNMKKESDWRVDSSSDSLNAFRAAMTNEAYYLSKIH